MKRVSMSLALAALLTAGTAIAKDNAAPVYGPEPDWPSFRRIAEAGIISRLIDPESARIDWMTGIRKGGFRPFLQRSVYGYVACGAVNARNRMGGYVGAQTFIVVIDYGLVLHAEIDRSSAGMITQTCATGIRDGMFPPVPVETTSVGSAPVPSPTGLTLRAMPEGAYVSAVASGSAADKAGLRPGMVIETINAISLGGMGEAMTKVVDAAGTKASLGLVGGKTIKMGEQH